MPFFQPKVKPLPSNIDLQGQTAVVTGASAGLGLEAARQLLTLKCSTVVLAVRNVKKGEACAEKLMKDLNLSPKTQTIKVLPLDVSDPASITSFTNNLSQAVPTTNILILNAGNSHYKPAPSPSGHEYALQVNYLSNTQLLAALLPYLEASATKAGHSVSVTWLGSRMHDIMTSFPKLPEPPVSVLGYVDSDPRVGLGRYADTKLLATLFMYTLAPRLDSNLVRLNMICPGMVRTGISDFLPFYFRYLFNVVVGIRARPVADGAVLVLNAALVAGAETHGRLLGDTEIYP